MREIQKAALIGLGGIGCAYASRIMDTEPRLLQVVAAAKRAARWQQGLQINGRHYQFTLTSPHGPAEPLDLILVAVKHYQLPQAILDLQRFVGPETIILSLLNGISSEETLAASFGWEHVLYGLCLSVDAVREGNKIEFSRAGKVYFGESRNEHYSPRVEAVQRFFRRCQIPHEVPLDMRRQQWWKFMINVGLNQLSGVLRAPYGVFQQLPEAAALMQAAMAEVVTLAQALGIDLSSTEIEDFMQQFQTWPAAGKTSLLQDVEAGRKTEVEMFAGEVCRLGRQANVATPINQMLLFLIQTKEKMAQLRC
ncbi:MAG TPA: ketopantoate reductase family protein [Oscillospiraceae bacterium]|nr:ketopantoate reductase family protein [Oscillospiraceae bacterium]